jgi:hypothetical protein
VIFFSGLPLLNLATGDFEKSENRLETPQLENYILD